MSSLTRNRASRSKWTPSQQQLQILENLFQQGSGTLNKQRVKEVAVELSQYGQIAEKNVKNWFQNRKARAKRRQQTAGRTTSRTRISNVSNNGESSEKIVAMPTLQLNLEKLENVTVDTDTAIASLRSKRPRLDTDQQCQESRNLPIETTSNVDTNVGVESSTCAGLTCGPTPLEDVRPPINAQFHETFDDLLGNTVEINVHPSGPDVTSIASIKRDKQHQSFAQATAVNETMGVKAWECPEEMLHIENPFEKSLISCRSDDEQMRFTSNEEGASACSNRAAGEWRLTSLAGGPIPSMDESHKSSGLFERPRNIM